MTDIPLIDDETQKILNTSPDMMRMGVLLGLYSVVHERLTLRQQEIANSYMEAFLKTDVPRETMEI